MRSEVVEQIEAFFEIDREILDDAIRTLDGYLRELQTAT